MAGHFEFKIEPMPGHFEIVMLTHDLRVYPNGPTYTRHPGPFATKAAAEEFIEKIAVPKIIEMFPGHDFTVDIPNSPKH